MATKSRTWAVVSTCDGSNGLPSAEVRALVLGTDGFLWVGTLGGLARYDGHTVTTYPSASTPGLVGDRIVDLLLAKNGAIWIATEYGAVSRLEGGEFQTVVRRGLNQLRTSLVEHADGSIWVGGDRLSRISRDLEVKRFEDIDPAAGEGPDEPTLVSLLDGRTLAILATGVYELREEPVLIQSMVSSGGFLDAGGFLWFTDCPEHREIPGVQSAPAPETLDVYPTMETVTLDSETILQLGLYGSFEITGTGEGAEWTELECDDNVRTGLVSNGGRTLILGTSRSGLAALAPSDAVPIPLPGVRGPMPSIAQIVDLGDMAIAFETIAGSAWVVSDGGVSPIREARWGNDLGARFGAAPLPGAGALVICQSGLARVDRGGQLVVLEEATEAVGLSSLANGHLYFGERHSWIWIEGALWRISDDGILFGDPVPLAVRPSIFCRYEGGVHFVDGHDVMHMDEVSGALTKKVTLDQHILRSACRDKTGALWITSYGDGLYRLRPGGKLDHWTRENSGLPDDFLGYVAPIDQANGEPRLWLNSNSGAITMTVAALDDVANGVTPTLISTRIATPEMNSASGAITPGA